MSISRSEQRTIVSLGCPFPLPQEQAEALRTAMEEHGGWLFRSELEGFWISFPAPLPALRATASALHRLPQLRAGLHLGDVTQTDIGDLLGHTLSVAKRLEVHSPAGQAMLSLELADRLSSPVWFADLVSMGQVELKGLGPMPAVRMLPRLQAERRPYKFLDAYNRDDATLFFGRTREIEEMHEILRGSRWLTLFGRSGVGKSSILAAGLLARYPQPEWSLFILRALTDPLEAIRKLELQSCQNGVIVVLDQFEEFFLRYPPQTRRLMLAELCGLLVDPDLPHVRWIFSMREDFLAEMGELEEHLPTFLDHRYRLTNLTRAQARECITAPADRCGLVVEEGLVEELLDSLDSQGVDPPELQIVLDRLDAGRHPGSVRLTLDSYRRMGGVNAILVDYLYEVLDRVDGSLARRVLLCMICDKGTKVALSAAEMVERTDIPRQHLEPVLASLVQARILRQLCDLGQFELSHEYLVAEIQSWADEAELSARHARLVLQHEVETRQRVGSSSLIDRDRLDFLAGQSERLYPTAAQRDLLVRSSLLHGRAPERWLPLENYTEVLLELLSDPNFPPPNVEGGELEIGEVKRRLIQALYPRPLGDNARQALLVAARGWGNPRLLQTLPREGSEQLFQAVQQRVRRRYFGSQAMSEIPEGPGWMGSTAEQKAARKAGLPSYLHDKVDSESELCRPHLPTFWIDCHLVTHSQFAEFDPSHLDRYPDDEDHYPVVAVSYQQAQAYATWLGKELVSEAEWEKAARGPEGYLYPWGNSFDATRTNCAEGGRRATTRVGSFPTGQSPYGCHDMAGNVWEWTSTPFFPDGPFLTQKGGSTLSAQGHLTASSRMDAFPDFVLQWVGFRLKTSTLPDLGL